MYRLPETRWGSSRVVLCWRQQRITQLKSELQDAERRQSEDIAKIAGDEPVSALESKARRNHGSSASSASVKLENMQKPRSEGWSRA